MESVVTAVIAILSGVGVLHGRVTRRMHELDRRIDAIEVKVAENYVTKADFTIVLDRVEGHMTRIENKIDKLQLLIKN